MLRHHRLSLCVPILCSAIALVLSASGASAQEQAPRDSVLAEFAADLASIQAEFESATKMLQRDSQPDSVEVTQDGTAVYADSTEDSRVVTRADEGTRFRLLSRVGDWYEVLLSPSEGNESTGWLPNASVALVIPTETGPEIIHEPAGALPDYGAYGGAQFDLGIWEFLIERAANLRDKWSDNQYVRVTGFQIQAGPSPSLSVDFEFK